MWASDAVAPRSFSATKAWYRTVASESRNSAVSCGTATASGTPRERERLRTTSSRSSWMSGASPGRARSPIANTTTTSPPTDRARARRRRRVSTSRASSASMPNDFARLIASASSRSITPSARGWVSGLVRSIDAPRIVTRGKPAHSPRAGLKMAGRVRLGMCEGFPKPSDRVGSTVCHHSPSRPLRTQFPLSRFWVDRRENSRVGNIDRPDRVGP